MSSSADKRMINMEDDRLRAINEGIGQVNAIFGGGRQRQYATFLDALRKRYSKDLGEQQKTVLRKSKFAAARRGVTGGSSEIDMKRRNAQNYLRALIGGENRAQASVAKLRMSDENSRQSLINSIYSGMDATTAANRGQGQMASNIDMAMSDFIPGALDSIGEAAADAYGYGVRNDAYSQSAQRTREQLYG